MYAIVECGGKQYKVEKDMLVKVEKIDAEIGDVVELKTLMLVDDNGNVKATTGKNSTDSALIIDAMDILYTGRVEGFCLVSSDSDFTRLAARLREAGMLVIGMGEKKTPRPFVTACNEFKFIDKIGKTAQSADSDSDKTAAAPAAGRDASTSQTDLSSIRGTILQQLANFSDEDGWMMASRIGDVLTQRYPDFDVRNYGHKKLTSFLNSFDDFELRTANENNADNPNGHTVYIRVKPKNARKH